MARHFSNWIQAYVDHTSMSESPTSFHFWTGVSTIAGALRRRVWIDQLSFQWVPNFYIILVGPPGVAAKSTSISTGMRMLSKVEGVYFGPQSMTWQALAKSLMESQQEIATVSPLGEKQIETISCLTIPVSELGTFFKMEDSSMMDVLVDLWDGKKGEWTHSTATTGSTKIQNPWLNVIGCTTPSWLKEHFPEHMIGGGLTSRILFIYGDAKRRFIAYPSEEVQTVDYWENEKRLISDLQQIALLGGEYRLTREAIQWGKEWYERHWTTRAEHMASDRYSGYLSRKQAHIHKLAIVLAAAKREQLIIEKQDLQEALQLIEIIEPSMQKVFESIGLVNEARRSHEILHYVRHYGVLSSDELWKLVSNIMSQKEFTEALTAAVNSGDLQGTMKDGKRAVKCSPQYLASQEKKVETL